MVEVGVIAGIEKGLEIALLSEASALQFELVVPTLVILGTVMAVHEIVKAVKKHKEEKQAEEQARIDAEQARIAEEQARIAEEQKNQEMTVQEMEENGINAENIEQTRLELERVARISAFKQRGQDEQTPDEMLLYPPGLREEIERLKAQEEEARRLEEERKRELDDEENKGNDQPNNDPDNDPDNDPNNGGGGGGGGGDPNNNNGNQNEENKNNNPYRIDLNPFADKLKNAGSQLLGQFGELLMEKKEAQEKVDKGEITQEEKDQIDRNIEIQQNQLESQKQMLDILEAIGLGELTQEQSLAELSNIEDELKKMEQRNAPVQVQNVYTNTVDQF